MFSLDEIADFLSTANECICKVCKKEYNEKCENCYLDDYIDYVAYLAAEADAKRNGGVK